MSDGHRQRLDRIAAATRQFLETVWPEWHAAWGEPPPVM
ncbi:hypothetical protein J2X65_000413 [Ancylobacter sp. 3268]|nr:hypothetical protein [Ancylobacter sp. 3268]